MFKRICLLLFLFLFFFPVKVYAADVVINEVFPDPSGSSSEDAEFIELFNKGSDAVVITNWKISDTSGSTSTFTIPENTLAAGGYIVFKKQTTNVSLNNSGDGVELKSESDQVVDSMSFGSTTEDKSWSRIPNGTGSFVDNTSSTESSANSAPPATPTPTPTTAPAATNAPTPTKTPTPTPLGPTSTPTKTPTPTKSKTPTPTPTVSKNATSTPNPRSDLRLASDDTGTLESIGGKNSKPTDTPKAQVLGISSFSIPWLFIALGLIFMAVCGILAYFQFGEKMFIWKRKTT